MTNFTGVEYTPVTVTAATQGYNHGLQHILLNDTNEKAEKTLRGVAAGLELGTSALHASVCSITLRPPYNGC